MLLLTVISDCWEMLPHLNGGEPNTLEAAVEGRGETNIRISRHLLKL